MAKAYSNTMKDCPRSWADIDTLNEKCVFAKGKIRFVGHSVTSDWIAPDPSKVRAIQEMPEPSCVANVRWLMGMANYLGKFVPHLTSFTCPLKDLLSEKNEWCCNTPQQEAFQKLKRELSSTSVLAQYSPTYETRLSADTSSFRLVGVLTQKQP